MKLKIYLPLKGAQITQGFSKNFNSYYKGGGLLGHTGIDFISYESDDILTAVEGAYTYKIINRNNPDPMAYRAVFQLVETDDGIFEVSYGHCSDIHCNHGPSPLGEVIAKEGNTGHVFTGGKEVTKEEKLAGSKKGTHLHFQIRKVKIMSSASVHETYLTKEEGGYYQDKNGFYYAIIDFNNGFNGCIDPTPYMVNQVATAQIIDKADHFDNYTPTIQKVLKNSTAPAWRTAFLSILEKIGYKYKK